MMKGEGIHLDLLLQALVSSGGPVEALFFFFLQLCSPLILLSPLFLCHLPPSSASTCGLSRAAPGSIKGVLGTHC